MPDPAAPSLAGYAVQADVTTADGAVRTVTFRRLPVAPPAPSLRVRLADAATCTPLAELADGTTVDMAGKGLLVDAAPGVWGVRFKWDGADVNRIEHNPPWSFSGDANGRLNPFVYAPGPHTLRVDAYADEATARNQTQPVGGLTLRFAVAGDAPTPPPDVTPGTTDAIQVFAGQPLDLRPGRVTALERGGVWRVAKLQPPDGCTLTAFGDPSKPLPRLASAGGGVVLLDGRRNVTLDHLALVGDHTDQVVGVQNGGGHAIQYCDISGGTFGITSEGIKGGHVTGLTIRWCDIHDNFNGTPGRDSSGVFAEMTEGLVVDHCVFDANGWNAATGAGQTVRNHHVYHHASSGPAVVTNNVFARPSAHGAQVRAGGTVTGNLFWNCPIGLDFGVVGGGGPPTKGGVTGAVRSNVFAGWRDTGTQQRGLALEIGNVRSATVDGNLIAHGFHPYSAINLQACKPDPGMTWDRDCVGIQDLTLTNNKLWDWPTAAPTLGLGYGARMGGTGNLSVAPLKQSGNVWARASKAVDLRAVLKDPVGRVRAGEKIEDLLAACFKAAADVR